MHETDDERRTPLRRRPLHAARRARSPARARRPRPTRCSTCSRARATPRSRGETHPLEAGTVGVRQRRHSLERRGRRAGPSRCSCTTRRPARRRHAVLDLTAAEKGSATAGRQFVLGARPETGCGSVTQFIGLVPPGRAPDHFHTYDEVIYILEGRGRAAHRRRAGRASPRLVRPPARATRSLPREHRRDRAAPARRLPARPARPAEAYYPDGTLAVPPNGGVRCRGSSVQQTRSGKATLPGARVI